MTTHHFARVVLDAVVDRFNAGHNAPTTLSAEARRLGLRSTGPLRRALLKYVGGNERALNDLLLQGRGFCAFSRRMMLQ